MVSLVIWIFVEIRRFDIREKKIKAEFVTDLWQYKRYFATFALFFGLSYLGRFITDIYGYGYCESHYIKSSFAGKMIDAIAWFFEGTSMGAIMILHVMSFRKRRYPPLIEEDEELEIISNDEDDADDLINTNSIERYTDEMEDSHEVFSVQAGSDIDADEQPVS